MLKGERVLLRPMIEADIPRQFEFFQDIELYLLDSDYPHVTSLESVRTFYENRTKRDDRVASFAIEAGGQYIGFCSLMGIGTRHGNIELGITIGDREYWGRGYGREVVNLLLRYAFQYLGVRRVELTTHAKNERAIRCYAACGFVEDGRPRKAVWIDGDYIDLVNMSILRDEWETAQ